MAPVFVFPSFQARTASCAARHKSPGVEESTNGVVRGEAIHYKRLNFLIRRYLSPFFINCLSVRPISLGLGFSLTILHSFSRSLWCWCSWLRECVQRNMSPQCMLTITLRLPRNPPVRKRETQQAWFNERWRIPWSKHTYTTMFAHVNAASSRASGERATESIIWPSRPSVSPGPDNSGILVTCQSNPKAGIFA